MSAIAKLLALGADAGTPGSYVDDVFATTLYEGTGASLTLTDNIDRTSGALDIFKGRAIGDWAWYDTARGVQKDLVSNSTAAETTQAQGVTATSSTGVTIGTLAKINLSGGKYVKHTFRESSKFFQKQVVAHTNGVADVVGLSTLGTVGMVAVKRADGVGNWMVWHRSQTAGSLTYLNLTSLETGDTSISMSGANLTLAAALASGSYVVYAWAHDSASDGFIQCGTFTSAAGVESVTLGWEPQYLLYKRITNTTGSWFVADVSRGVPTGSASTLLSPDSSAAEAVGLNITFSPTGFSMDIGSTGDKWVYMAVRRQNKPPTSGTEVFMPVAYTGNGVDNDQVAGFQVDVAMVSNRSNGGGTFFVDRMRGNRKWPLDTYQALAEPDIGGDYIMFDNMTKLKIVNNGINRLNASGQSYVLHAMKRAPGFMDLVPYTGTGASHTESHNLTIIPELMIVKKRNGGAGAGWYVYHSAIGPTKFMSLNGAAAVSAPNTAIWNDTVPTASVFTIGTDPDINQSSSTYIAYLFATLSGISKVFNYTGNGTSQTINCDFAAGARFVMIKRTDSTGEWYVWDTARGIVAGNDPHLSLNSTDIEVTTDDSVDPTAAGFIVNQVAATNINVIGGTYVGLAIA